MKVTTWVIIMGWRAAISEMKVTKGDGDAMRRLLEDDQFRMMAPPLECGYGQQLLSSSLLRRAAASFPSCDG